MKLLKKAYTIIYRKNLIPFAGAILILLLLKKPIEHWISSTVVENVLSQVQPTWYVDICIGLFALLVLALNVYRFRKYYPSKGLSIFLFVITVFYCFYRISEGVWEFTGFHFLPFLRYADILIFLSACQLLLFVPQKKTLKNNEEAFFDDVALGVSGDDDLGYGKYAELVANKITNSHFNGSFAIGINGKWGLGKTSFIDLLKRTLKGDDFIEVNFNAWNSQSPNSIIKDFFETVHEAIRPYHSSLARLFIQYSNRLVTLHKNTITQTIQTLVATLTGFESINSLHKEINEALVRIDRKIIVYIDDLDRLDKNEIIEVIRLIRNTANFHNTFFIVAYDRNYVVNALSHHTSYNQEAFLEKIFQIEITLPYFKKDILRYKLAERLKDRVPVRLHKEIENAVIGDAASTPEFLNEWLESMRDVTRLSNSFILNFTSLQEEVVIGDLLRIELLRLKYPSAYELLYRRTNYFLATTADQYKNKNSYHLKPISQEERGNSPEDEGYHSHYEEYLCKNNDNLSIPKGEIDKIINLVSGLFNRGLSINLRDTSHLSIVYPSKFHNYFSYSLLDGNLSEVQFSKARILGQEEFNKKISEWVAKGLQIELRNRFMEITSFDNREDFEKIIKGIFYFANLPNDKPSFYGRKIVGYDGKDLLEKMNKNVIDSKFYSSGNGENELQNFVKSLFAQAQSPYSFEIELLYYLGSEGSDSFPLSKNKILEMAMNFFKAYTDEIDTMDSNIWHLLWHCEKVEWISTGPNTSSKYKVLPERAKEVMKNFILKKDVDGFLLDIIKVELFHEKRFAVNNDILKIFDSWQIFEEELNQLKEDEFKYLEEFKRFLAKFASKNYSLYVEFKFDQIPINKKIKNR